MPDNIFKQGRNYPDLHDFNRSNPFGSNHFNLIGPYLKHRFGCRVVKLSLDAGFTCPNRDGTKGRGGCIFCSADGSGQYASNIPDQIRLLADKWPDSKYIAYFQSHTNTYAPVDTLRRLFDDALSRPDVIGLAVATRPDCLPPDVLSLLEEYNQKTYLWVELGLQTIHDRTAERLNRCYPFSVFSQAMAALSERGIRTVVHLILGLPWENRTMMLESAARVGSFHPFGMKLHLLHVLRQTPLETLYKESFPDLSPEAAKTAETAQDCPFWHIFSRSEYTGLVADILETLPPDITIHRVTGDAPRSELIAPIWSADKRAVLNGIQKELKHRESWQGKFYLPSAKHSPRA